MISDRTSLLAEKKTDISSEGEGNVSQYDKARTLRDLEDMDGKICCAVRIVIISIRNP